jgi:hypothetical protein
MFDRQKLERLRAKFGDAGGNEIFDPHFRAVADSVFKFPTDARPLARASRPCCVRRSDPISPLRWRTRSTSPCSAFPWT